MDLSSRVNRWKQRSKRNRKKTEVIENARLNNEYKCLIVRYGLNDDGSWKHTARCDLREAASLLSKPMFELYDGLEATRGFFRTMRFELEVCQTTR
jgi:hypothetical protein